MVPISIVALAVCALVMIRHLFRDQRRFTPGRRRFYDGAFIVYGVILVGFSYSGYHEAQIIGEGWIFVIGMALGVILLALLPLARLLARRSAVGTL